jgi:predicted O-methyltransferase YrrM
MSVMIDKISNVLNPLYERDEKERASGHPDDMRMMALNRHSGQFVHMICRSAKAGRILEIGTSYGVSTIWLAWAASEFNGKITTIEIDPDRAKAAQENFRKAGLSQWINVIVGDGKHVVKTLRDPIDLAFIDTVKKDYAYYLKTIFPLLPKGAIVLADNAISHADQLQEYFATLEELGFKTMTLPIGAGIEFSVKFGS